MSTSMPAVKSPGRPAPVPPSSAPSTSATETETVSAPSPRMPAGLWKEQRIAIRDVSWELYDALTDAIGEHQRVFVAFDGRDMEIMTKGRSHAIYKEALGWFIRYVVSELRIRCRGAGETTWKRPEIERGLEADQCYYFDPEKLAADAASVARKENNVAHYPNPDMAVEIDLSPPTVDRPAIYAALKVSEIWRFDGEVLVIEDLQPDGTYAPVEFSRYLPVRAEEVHRWVAVEDTSDELAWEERLRAWARAELAPRRGG